MFPVNASSAVFVVKIGQILSLPFFRILIILDSLVVWNNYDGGDIICMRNGKSYSRRFSPKTVMLTKVTYKNVLEHKHKQVRQHKYQVNYVVTFRDRILRTFHCRFWSSHSCSWDICMFSSKSHVLVNLTIDVIWPWSLNPRFWRCHKMEFHTSPLLPTFHNR